MININQITKYLPTSGLVLENVSLTLKESEITALIGANGSGKSTLSKIIAGIDSAYQGSISGINHGQVALVPQDYKSSLLPWMTVKKKYSFSFKN